MINSDESGQSSNQWRTIRFKNFNCDLIGVIGHLIGIGSKTFVSPPNPARHWRESTERRQSESPNASLRGGMPRDYVHCISDRITLEFRMQRLSLIAMAAAAVAFVSSPSSVVRAQNTPSTGAGTTTAPAAAPAAPAAAPAATTTTPAAGTAATTTAEPAKEPKKKKAAKKKMTRQQEIDKSVDSGTVPARYRSSVPKQYQQYIPFDKQ
jgi:hypothetical protein